MCGIVGLWKHERPVTLDELETMRDSLAHRGPDDSGARIDASANLGLGHRRLSILDLSSAGAQPMTGSDGRLTIVLNGEIYNYRELRREAEEWGYRFRSNTDTEVILACYERFGVDCLERLRGMFAFALWDSTRRELLLVRDRVGIKPLYYYWDGRTFAFASETRAFQQIACFDRTLDVSALYDYFTYQYIPAPKSIFANIRKLEAGNALVFKPEERSLDMRRYWRLRDAPGAADDSEEVIAEAGRLLRESVRYHLVSDVPVGAFLSGGMDSSTVVAIASEFLPGLQAFTVDFDVKSRSEVNEAAALARHLRLDHRVVKMNESEFEMFAERFVDIYDEPFGDTSGLPTYAVSELAGRTVKVALSGDGGDEIFGGYVPLYYGLVNGGGADLFSRLMMRVLYGMPVKLGARFMQTRLPSAHRVIESPVYLRCGQKRLFFNRGLLRQHDLGRDYEDAWLFNRHLPDTDDPIRARMLLDFYTWLPEKMLTKVDRASMANSLEVRVPLLDHPLVEYMLSLPSRFHYDASKGAKWVLRETLDRHVPSEITRRPKRGFTIPLREWLGAHSGYVDDRIRGSRIVREGVFSRGRLSYADTRSALTKWMLLNMAIWSDRYQWNL